MLKRNVQNLNKEYLLICIVKVGVRASALTAPSQRAGSLQPACSASGLHSYCRQQGPVCPFSHTRTFSAPL